MISTATGECFVQAKGPHQAEMPSRKHYLERHRSSVCPPYRPKHARNGCLQKDGSGHGLRKPFCVLRNGQFSVIIEVGTVLQDEATIFELAPDVFEIALVDESDVAAMDRRADLGVLVQDFLRE